MVEWPEVIRPLAEELNSCEYLFLREMGEPAENRLRLVVEEAVVSGEPFSRRIGETELTDLRAIESTDQCRLFEIVWDGYVAFSVTNELYGKLDEAGTFIGKLFRLHASSYFLEHIARATIATAKYPGPLQHISVICQNHVIDVVFTSPPAIISLR